jgi:serine/threonine protein kinase/tetratricopeptide (TPR) repeat protein
VAVKLLSQNSHDRLGSQGRARLLHEAKSAARLNHPNIVSIYDAGQEDGSSYIVMELVEGDSLYERKPETDAEILSTAYQIAAALHHAHSLDVVHRDLKPENILITNGQVKLTDFGLARSATSRLTADKLIAGTVLYLAPEAALGQGVDARSDLYSFGVILYEMMTGLLPFSAEDPLAVISQHLYSPVTPPHAHRADVSPALEKLVLQMLEKQPEARPASAYEVQQALKLMMLEPALPQPAPGPSDPSLLLDRLVRGRLIGRERELAEMKAFLAQALGGQSSILLLSGESGIGKTRLARELLAHAAVSGVRVLSGSCYNEGGVPYAPFPQLIADSFNIPTIQLDLPEYVLTDVLAVAPELRGRFPNVMQPAASPVGSDQRQIFDSLAAWASFLAAQTPLLLFIDDVHWADSSTLFLLRHLARRLQNQRVLILLTYREVELNEATPLQTVLFDLNRERLSVRIKLSRFERSQTQALLEAMLLPSGAIDPTLVDAIYRETEGNPFFIEEVTKALLEEGKLCFNEICWVAQNETAIEIPQSVRLTIQNRLSRLPEATQDVLRLAAVIGRRFEFDVLLKASDLDEDALIDALENAERAQIVNDISTGRGAPALFSFAHALIPAALRESVSSLRRQRLHRRVAVAIEAAYGNLEIHLESLAYHYEQAGDAEQAEEYYARAGFRALGVYANQEAARYFTLALEMEPEGLQKAHLLGGLGEALFRQSLYKKAAESWMEAIHIQKQAGCYGDMAYLYARAARATWYLGDMPASLRLCLEGIETIPASEGETPGLAALLHETARAYRFNNQLEEALPLCQRALEIADRFGLVEVQAESLTTLGILPNLPIEQRLNTLEKAVELSESAGLHATAARANVNLSAHMRDQLKFDKSLSHLKRAAELAHRLGSATWEHTFLNHIIDMLLEMGDLKGASDYIEDMQALHKDIPDAVNAEKIVSGLEGRLERYYGHLEKARQILLEGSSPEGVLHLPSYLGGIKITLADICLEEGVFAEAEQILRECLDLLKDEPPEARFALPPLLAYAAAGQGRFEEAHGLIEEARLEKDRMIRPAEVYMLRYYEAQICLLEGRLDEAADHFEFCTKVTMESGMRWYYPVCLRRWAEALRARKNPGDLEKAVQLLEQARQTYDELDLPVYAGQISEIIEKIDIIEGQI